METGVSAVLMVATMLRRGQRLLYFHTPPPLLLLLHQYESEMIVQSPRLFNLQSFSMVVVPVQFV